MKLSFSYFINRFDWILFCIIFLLTSFSVVILYSIALGSELPIDMLNFKKQLLFACIGISIYFGIAFFIDYSSLIISHRVLYFMGVILLIAVLLFGSTVRGTTGWFVFGPVSFQPVELIKIFSLISLSAYLTRVGRNIVHLKTVIMSIVGVAMYAALILLQPDFGSAFLLLSLWFGLVILAGMRARHSISLILIGIVAIVGLWFFGFAEYQKNRIKVFIDPTLDPLGVGYNVTQSMIAIGSGELWGKGLSFGSQSKLKFLPEAQTDFIFAVIAEQLGFIGVLVLLSLYCALIMRLIVLAYRTKESMGSFVIIGAAIIIGIQLLINIGMNLGLLPVTGITLPLMSYGGSSLVSTFILLGLVQSVVMRARLTLD